MPYELCTIKPKGGFYARLVFNSTYQVLAKFRKKNKHSVLVKTTVIYVFILNKLDFSNCFLTFLTLKLFLNIIKRLCASQF